MYSQQRAHQSRRDAVCCFRVSCLSCLANEILVNGSTCQSLLNLPQAFSQEVSHRPKIPPLTPLAEASCYVQGPFPGPQEQPVCLRALFLERLPWITRSKLVTQLPKG